MKKQLPILLAFLVLFSGTFSSAASLPSLPSNEPDPVTVKAAVKDFNNLSKKEKREKVKEVKMAMKDFKANKNSSAAPSTNTLLLVILAILLPPLAVYLHQGEINNKFWIALILTLLFFVPGIIYALIVILGNG